MNADKTQGCWRWCYKKCTCCLSEKEKNAIAVHNEIERVLLNESKTENREQREMKVLLLGTRESGKTTFIKQMRIIHGNGFSEEDRCAYAKPVFQNIYTAMKALTQAMTILKIPYANPQNEVYSQQLQEVEINQMTQLNSMHVEAIRHLWADAGVKACYRRRREYQLLDSTEYQMTNLDRIAAADYIPTTQDVLRVRSPTTGINDYSVVIEGCTVRFIDVGSQKSEWRKWIHCFENVTSVIFLASLSEYDQVLEENNQENRMKESLSLFHTTIHSPWFANSSIILFLNKTDILEEKIQTSDLQTYFPDFQGNRRDPQKAREYIAEMYKQQGINAENNECKHIYPHFICATDTKEMQVFSVIKNAFLSHLLRKYNVL